MINFKEIVWVEETVDCTDTVYWTGRMNEKQVAAVHNWEEDGFVLFDHIGKTGIKKDPKYPTIEEAKAAAKVMVENYLMGFIDTSHYIRDRWI